MSSIVLIDCDAGNQYDDSKLGIRISSIFVVFAGSMLGVLLPLVLAKSNHSKTPFLLSIMKNFGSGVIIATAFIHLLAPAIESLSSPCLAGPITKYSWAEGIALISILAMFFIELMVDRFDSFGLKVNDLEEQPHHSKTLKSSQETDSQSIMQPSVKQNHSQKSSDSTLNESSSSSGNTKLGDLPPELLVTAIPGVNKFTYTSRGNTNNVKDQFTVRMITIFILEFGIIFHSIFIGLTLAVTSNDNFNVLYIALVFHQCFEGLGLGSRLADVPWPNQKTWIPWALGISFGLTTPVAIAIGLIIHNHFVPGSQEVLIVNGVFDSISAGILIYTGLVELIAQDFIFNQEMRKTSIKSVLFAYLQICCGAGLMAILGKWA